MRLFRRCGARARLAALNRPCPDGVRKRTGRAHGRTAATAAADAARAASVEGPRWKSGKSHRATRPSADASDAARAADDAGPGAARDTRR